ncbi:MAG: relaxase/mobilization nuclease domain-containing protein [Clostridiaceae bacterium]|nr:relaxase/mobilization nuclease domain-containing protein [Clostridiaceae bacterium]
MAITKIHAIKATVNKAIDYITNPDKTDGMLLVSGYNCEADYAYLDFKMTETLAKEVNGDYTKTGGANNLAYHTIQSFSKTDKLTPEEAHEIGKKLADEMLQGKHEYIITTHIDKGHIHNHIIFNAVSFYDYTKFRSEPYKTAAKIRSISDRLCDEKGLNVIRQPKGKGKSRTEWEAIKEGTSWKEQIKNTIDHLIPQATDYNSFVALMKNANIEIKEGKHISFRLNGQERFARGKTIGAEYTKEQIINRIGERAKTTYKEITLNEKLILGESEKGFFTRIPYTQKYIWFSKEQCQWTNAEHKTLHINISTEQQYEFVTKTGEKMETITGEVIHKYYDDAAKMREEKQAGKEAGQPVKEDKKILNGKISEVKKRPLPLANKIIYATKKQQNIDTKQLANMLLMLRRENIQKFSDIDTKIAALKEQSLTVREDIKQLDSKNEKYKETAKYLVSYNKYLPIKLQYEKQTIITKKSFYNKNESELLAFEHAAKQLEKLGVNTNVNSDKVIELVKQQTKQVTELHDQYKKTDSRVEELRKAQAVIQNLIKPQERKQVIETEKKQEQGER